MEKYDVSITSTKIISNFFTGGILVSC